MPTLYKEDIATKVTMNSNITYSLSLFLKLHCADYTIAVVSVCVCVSLICQVCVCLRGILHRLLKDSPLPHCGV